MLLKIDQQLENLDRVTNLEVGKTTDSTKPFGAM